MAKTANPQIDIFSTLEKAQSAFDKCSVPCDLLYSKGYKSWYLDRAKDAIKEWPSLYTLVASK